MEPQQQALAASEGHQHGLEYCSPVAVAEKIDREGLDHAVEHLLPHDRRIHKKELVQRDPRDAQEGDVFDWVPATAVLVPHHLQSFLFGFVFSVKG